MQSPRILTLCGALLLSAAAFADTSSVDGVLGAEWTGVIPVSVGYDAGADTSNFGTPSNVNSNVAYDIYFRSDSTYVYGLLETKGSANGLNFANLYFDTNPLTSPGSDLGFEVTNDRAFIPGVPGYSTSLTAQGFAFASAGDAIIEWAMPWTFFTNDPLGMGFPKITATDNKLTLRLSQSFGYSVAGGATYGADRLGSVFYEASSAAVPEPSSLLLALTMLCGAGIAARRKR